MKIHQQPEKVHRVENHLFIINFFLSLFVALFLMGCKSKFSDGFARDFPALLFYISHNSFSTFPLSNLSMKVNRSGNDAKRNKVYRLIGGKKGFELTRAVFIYLFILLIHYIRLLLCMLFILKDY